jgi:hypothetical protein
VADVVCSDMATFNLPDGPTFYGYDLYGLVERYAMFERYVIFLKTSRSTSFRILVDGRPSRSNVAYKAVGLFNEFVNSNYHLVFYIHQSGPLNFNNL